ncbi:hypothetical protein scyTo_0016332 [Scyliorhinus torazame]|uniref:Uncharacterized protein n=1 Tax=Scyliorhinus torazame TaxID=75743 RepID=A0A401Q5M7_SCYTO|nr:hypothetical protein [Scyliorhinus torazame]
MESLRSRGTRNYMFCELVLQRHCQCVLYYVSLHLLSGHPLSGDCLLLWKDDADSEEGRDGIERLLLDTLEQAEAFIKEKGLELG